MSMSRPAEIGSLKEGMYVVVDGEPSRVVTIEKSKPGKHGSAKVRLVAVGVFDNVKRSIVSPVDAKVDVPMIDKRNGQVISVSRNTVQIMDLESFEVLEVANIEAELLDKLKPSVEVEYWMIMGRPKLIRVKS
ncbi:translation initiation factor IF-5A [Candidatus Bathyarchaeota archaeon]|nr:translation initiation factor IF-5A [Candidatus Bathyarchaeota archaeon]MBS7613573.1 translation initiation factor IF-5A [Candidatus Bathyarchaeota archaeon]MBS7618610.1 translation initiation factor IF-5A [Candidatus Bathyarchaeota archaeon]